MGSTYHSLHYHFVCSTKERRSLIRSPWKTHFHEYLGGAVRGLEGVPLIIGGVEDHVHLLVGLKPTHCISHLSQEWKKASSIWVAEKYEKEFKWQEGYSVFTVSISMLETVKSYIERQEEHHQKRHSKRN